MHCTTLRITSQHRNKADAAYKAQRVLTGAKSAELELAQKARQDGFRCRAEYRRGRSEPGQAMHHLAAEVTARDEMEASEWTRRVSDGAIDEFAFMSALTRERRTLP